MQNWKAIFSCKTPSAGFHTCFTLTLQVLYSEKKGQYKALFLLLLHSDLCCKCDLKDLTLPKFPLEQSAAHLHQLVYGPAVHSSNIPKRSCFIESKCCTLTQMPLMLQPSTCSSEAGLLLIAL